MKLHPKIRVYTKRLNRTSSYALTCGLLLISCGTSTNLCHDYSNRIQRQPASVQDCVEQIRTIAGPELDMWKADPEPLSYTELHLRLDKGMVATIYHDPVPVSSSGDMPLERILKKKVSQIVISKVINTLESCSDTVRLPRE